MLVILFAWSLGTAISFVAGASTIRAFGRWAPTSADPPVPFAVVCVLGLGVVTSALAAISLVAPLGGPVPEMMLGAAALGAFVLRRGIREDLRLRFACRSPQDRFGIFLFLLGAGGILWWTSLAPDSYDSGAYHVQAIRWIHDYPVVPGLANLMVHLGLNSHWFVACAAFDGLVPGAGSVHALNGLVLCWLLAFCLPGLTNLLNGDWQASAWLRSGLLGALLARYLIHCSSPLSEVPTTVFFGMAVVWRMEGILERPREPLEVRSAVLILVVLFLPTLKLSAAGALFLVPLLTRDLAAKGAGRAACFGLGASLFMGIPWLLRNAFLSGYLLFPSAFPDLLRADWKIPRPEVEALMTYIRGWGRIQSSSFDATMKLSPLVWIPQWYGALSILGKTLVAACALFPVLLAFWAAARPSRAREVYRHHRDEVQLWASTYAGLLFWFFLAPDTRFGATYLLPLCLLAVGSVLSRVKLPPYPAVRLGVWVAAAVSVGFFAWCGVRTDRRAGFWVFPGPCPQVEVSEIPLSHGHVKVPVSGFLLWDAPLPATNSPRPGLEWRGTRMSEGFRRASPP